MKQTKQIVVRQKNVPKETVTTVVTTPKATSQRKRNRRRRRSGGSRSSVPPYVQTLLNPDGIRGASIPDTISMASGNYSYVVDFSYGCDASGNGVIFFCPKMVIGNASQSTVANGAGLIGGNSTAGYGTTANPLAALLANPDVSANVERFRVVSAELQVWSSQAPVNIQGKVTSGLLPGDFDMGASTAATSFALISQLPNTRTSHLLDGGRALYLPGGPEDLLYAPCTADFVPIHAFTLGNGGTNTGAFHSTNGIVNQANTNSGSGPTLFVAVTGATASVSLNCRLVVNIQYLPQSSNAFVQLEPVEPDPVAMTMANRLASIPRALQGFYENHAEVLSTIVDRAMSGAANFARSPIGTAIASNAMRAVTNALAGTVASRSYGGQMRGSFPPRLY